MRYTGVFLLGAALNAMAQTLPQSVCMSWSTVGSSTTTSSPASSTTAVSGVPTCGFRGWDKGTNVGYYAGGQYGSFAACSALCDVQLACLSFTYLTNGPCIIYNYLVEGNMTPDYNSPYAFFDKGGICPLTAQASSYAVPSTTSVVQSSTAQSSAASSSSSSSSSASSSTTTTSSSQLPASTSTTSSSRAQTTLVTSTAAPSTTSAAASYTTLFVTTIKYATSTYTTSTCAVAGFFTCASYSTFTTYSIVPVSTAVPYATLPVLV